MKVESDLALVASNAHLVSLIAYLVGSRKQRETKVLVLSYEFDLKLLEIAKQHGVRTISLEKAKEEHFDNLLLFPNFFLLASDFADHNLNPLGQFHFDAMVWAADIWANKIFIPFYLLEKIPREVVYFGVELVEECIIENTPYSWGEIPRRVVTVQEMAEVWKALVAHLGVPRIGVEAKRTSLCILRDWADEGDFRYSPASFEATVDGTVNLLTADQQIKSVVIRDIRGAHSSNLAKEVRRGLEAKNLEVWDWSEAFEGHALATMPEALLFEGLLKRFAGTFCFDSSLNLLFLQKAYFEGEVLEMSSEFIDKVFPRASSRRLVREQMNWMQEASVRLNTLNSASEEGCPKVSVHGYEFAMFMGQSLAWDYRSQREKQRLTAEKLRDEFQRESVARERKANQLAESLENCELRANVLEKKLEEVTSSKFWKLAEFLNKI